MTQNQIAYWNLQELKRSNKEKEKENYRSNSAKESENYRHNVSTEQLGYGELAEKNRHNLKGEQIDSRKIANDLIKSTLDRKSRETVAEKDRASREYLDRLKRPLTHTAVDSVEYLFGKKDKRGSKVGNTAQKLMDEFLNKRKKD